jgi:hypothetical protein
VVEAGDGCAGCPAPIRRRRDGSAWCREQGLYPAELDAWKQDAWKQDAIAGLGNPRAASAAEASQRGSPARVPVPASASVPPARLVTARSLSPPRPHWHAPRSAPGSTGNPGRSIRSASDRTRRARAPAAIRAFPPAAAGMPSARRVCRRPALIRRGAAGSLLSRWRRTKNTASQHWPMRTMME